MGHERVMTALTSYGPVSSQRQAKLLQDLGVAGKRSRADLVNQLSMLTEELRNAE